MAILLLSNHVVSWFPSCYFLFVEKLKQARTHAKSRAVKVVKTKAYVHFNTKLTLNIMILLLFNDCSHFN